MSSMHKPGEHAVTGCLVLLLGLVLSVDSSGSPPRRCSASSSTLLGCNARATQNLGFSCKETTKLRRRGKSRQIEETEKNIETSPSCWSDWSHFDPNTSWLYWIHLIFIAHACRSKDCLVVRLIGFAHAYIRPNVLVANLHDGPYIHFTDIYDDALGAVLSLGPSQTV